MAPVVISPSGKHTATLIFCHGLGDTGHGWASTLADVRQSHVKIICPTAETMPVTLNSGKDLHIAFIDYERITYIGLNSVLFYKEHMKWPTSSLRN